MILLTGAPGSGKSTLARRLAHHEEYDPPLEDILRFVTAPTVTPSGYRGR